MRNPLHFHWLEAVHIIAYMCIYAAAFVMYCFGLDNLDNLNSYRYFCSAALLALAGYLLSSAHHIDED